MLDHKIRSWLLDSPGLITGRDSVDVLRKAWAAFAVVCSVGDFTDVLWRAGYRPEQVGARWQLALPAKPLEAPNNIHRLRNIAGRGRG